MEEQSLYERYHNKRLYQRKVIRENNFTYRNLIAVVKDNLGGKNSILDIGCGVGTLCFYLASKNKKVVGIDISSKAIKVARRNAKYLGLEGRIKFLQKEFPQKMTMGRYDLIICSEVLEHIKNDRVAVRKILKMLKDKNSVVIVSVPSKNAPLYRLGLLNSFDSEVGHLRRYDAKELKTLFSEEGYRVTEIRKTEGVLRNFLFTNKAAGHLIRFLKGFISDIFTFIDNVTIDLFGESQIYLVATKK